MTLFPILTVDGNSFQDEQTPSLQPIYTVAEKIFEQIVAW